MVNVPKGRTERLTVRLNRAMDELLEKVAKERGISKNDLIESIILEWAYRNGHNRVLHFNVRGPTVTLWDELLNQTVDLLYEEPEKHLYCTHCKTDRCGHVWWAVNNIPEIKKKVKKGEIIYEEF